jgi:poly-beta-1,6-N-acetyl-D-glucosamine synthase
MNLSDTTNVVKNDVAYVLITPAWNEEALIELPIQAVVSQTIPPSKYIVVSDGSTDRTDDIVESYSKKYPFIQLYRMPQQHNRSFAAQVDAINAGYQQLRDLDFEFVGNLDADVTFEPDYFERLFQKFQNDRTLGMAGGVIHDKTEGGGLIPRKLNRLHSVMHGVQMFRRVCFDALGGYTPLPHGSPDWHAEVRLRMLGWQVRSIPGLVAVQHRPNGGAGNMLWYFYRQGRADYSLGTHPLFEVAKIVRRLPSKPYVLAAFAELTGFISAYCRGEKRAVADDFVRFLRNEQLSRLRLRPRNT